MNNSYGSSTSSTSSSRNPISRDRANRNVCTSVTSLNVVLKPGGTGTEKEKDCPRREGELFVAVTTNLAQHRNCCVLLLQPSASWHDTDRSEENYQTLLHPPDHHRKVIFLGRVEDIENNESRPGIDGT